MWRWTEATGLQEVYIYSGDPTDSSMNGKVIAGYVPSNTNTVPLLWSEQAGQIFVDYPNIAPGVPNNTNRFTGVVADASGATSSIITSGYALAGSTYEGYYWTLKDGYTFIDGLPTSTATYTNDITVVETELSA
jgi:hypothetical protein